jgi:hypothetical protein
MQKRWNDIIIRLGKNSGGLKKKKKLSRDRII